MENTYLEIYFYEELVLIILLYFSLFSLLEAGYGLLRKSFGIMKQEIIKLNCFFLQYLCSHVPCLSLLFMK